jgi:hypothetical protein
MKNVTRWMMESIANNLPGNILEIFAKEHVLAQIGAAWTAVQMWIVGCCHGTCIHVNSQVSPSLMDDPLVITPISPLK